MTISAIQMEEAAKDVQTALQLIETQPDLITFDKLTSECAKLATPEVFEAALLTAILRATDVKITDETPFATVHQLFTYGRFIEHNGLERRLIKIAQTSRRQPSVSPLVVFNTLNDINPIRPGSICEIYLDKVIKQFWTDLLDPKVENIPSLQSYLDTPPYLSERYFTLTDFKAIHYLQGRIQRSLVEHFNQDKNRISHDKVAEFPHNQVYRKLKQCLTQEGWLHNQHVQFKHIEAANSLANAISGYLANQFAQLNDPDPLAHPSIPDNPLVRRGKIENDPCQNNVAHSYGDKFFQQDTYFSETLSANFAKDDKNAVDNIVAQLAILSDYDREILMWNLILNLQRKYGNRERTRVVVNRHDLFSGSTANVALAVDNKIYLSTIGDSESIIIVRKKNGSVTAKRHHPLDDLPSDKRIQDDYHSAQHRSLGMARSIGDCDKDTGGLLHHPHVMALECSLEEGDEAFVLHVTDGFRNAFPDPDAIDTIVGDSTQKLSFEKHIATLVSQLYAANPESNTRKLDIAKIMLQSAYSHCPLDFTMDNTTALVQPVQKGISSLSAIFDGHGCTPRDRDLSGERLVSKQLKEGLKITFIETLQAAYDQKCLHPDAAITALKTATGNFEVLPPAPAPLPKSIDHAPPPQTPAPAKTETRATIAGPTLDCLNSYEKIDLLNTAWQQIQTDFVRQKQGTQFTPLQQIEYKYEKSMSGTIDSHRIVQTNNGITHIDSVNPITAEAGLRLHIAARLMVETKSPSGEIKLEMLSPVKNKQGLLCYPEQHKRAGELICIVLLNCKNQETENILIEAAKRLGLTVQPQVTEKTKELAESTKALPSTKDLALPKEAPAKENLPPPEPTTLTSMAI